MLVGGRFERAYLRIQRAADCSCAEMIYIDTNWRTFWSYTLIDMCMCVGVFLPPPPPPTSPVKFATARKVNRKANLHISYVTELPEMWARWSARFRHSACNGKRSLYGLPCVCRCSLVQISKANQKKKQNLSRQLESSSRFPVPNL